MMNVFEKIREKFANIRRVVTCDEDLEWNRAVCECETLVNQVEQEHNNGWISCSERLPEIRCEAVLATTRDGILWTAIYEPFNGKDEWFDDNYEKKLDVIAWMPLPQPYKERDTNGN